jgi:hypothetical protein
LIRINERQSQPIEAQFSELIAAGPRMGGNSRQLAHEQITNLFSGNAAGLTN